MRFVSVMVIVILIGSLFNGCTKEPPEEKGTVEIADELNVPEPDADINRSEPLEGEWSGNRFDNDFFGIHMVMPDDWHRLTEEELLMIESAGSALVEAESEVVTLLGISGRPLDDEAEFNPTLLINVYQGDSSSEELEAVMNDTLSSLIDMAFDFSIREPVERIYFEEIEGLELMMSVPVDGSMIFQTFFVGAWEGWLIEVTITYSEDEADLIDRIGVR